MHWEVSGSSENGWETWKIRPAQRRLLREAGGQNLDQSHVLAGSVRTQLPLLWRLDTIRFGTLGSPACYHGSPPNKD